MILNSSPMVRKRALMAVFDNGFGAIERAVA